MGDTWLDPGTCGVKLAQFEAMTTQMTRAATGLETLSHTLWQLLNEAGVSTTPALEIKKLATWTQEAATDLKRRNILAHNLEREKLAFPIDTKDGTYLKLPDRYTDQTEYVHGLSVANLIKRAQQGDRKALAALGRIDPSLVHDPFFARGMLIGLGPEGLVEAPVELTRRLAVDRNTHADGLQRTAQDTRNTLILLGQTLALGTRPSSRAYVGDDYLMRLRAAGGAHFPPHSTVPTGIVGYQAIVTLLQAAGSERFSTQFFKTVGRGMISYDRSVHKDMSWRGLPDLIERNSLGNLLDPAGSTISFGERRTDFLSPLLRAAANSDREGAQALLDYQNVGDPNSNLVYLLHDRRTTWGYSDRGDSLGRTIKAAMSGRDKDSTRLFEQVITLLGQDARKYIIYKDGHQLAISNKDALDNLSGLRIHMAATLITHLNLVSNQLFAIDATGRLSEGSQEAESNLIAVIADVVQDDDAFTALATAQIGHTRAWLDRQYVRGVGVDVGVVAEAQMLGYLLALRRETMAARGVLTDKERERFKNLINQGLGFLPVPYVSKFGGVTQEIYDQVVRSGYTKVGQLLVGQADSKPETLTESSLVTDEQAIINLMKQILIASAVYNHKQSTKDLHGLSFAQNGKIIPPENWTKDQTADFIRWCTEENIKAPQLGSVAESAIERSHNKAIRTLINQGN